MFRERNTDTLHPKMHPGTYLITLHPKIHPGRYHNYLTSGDAHRYLIALLPKMHPGTYLITLHPKIYTSDTLTMKKSKTEKKKSITLVILQAKVSPM